MTSTKEELHGLQEDMAKSEIHRQELQSQLDSCTAELNMTHKELRYASATIYGNILGH